MYHYLFFNNQLPILKYVKN